MNTIRLPLKSLRRDGGTQPRAVIDAEVAYEYGHEMKAGAKFPPVVAFYDGISYWLADGFHRLEGAFSADFNDIEVDVHQGTQQDAQWYSFGVNKSHGLRRTNQDKQSAVKAALLHPYGAGQSNSAIAKHVGADDQTVANWREKLESTSEIRKSESRMCSDGRTINTGNIGKRKVTAEDAKRYAQDPRIKRTVQVLARANDADVQGGPVPVPVQVSVTPLVDHPLEVVCTESGRDRLRRVTDAAFQSPTLSDDDLGRIALLIELQSEELEYRRLHVISDNGNSKEAIQ